MDRWMDEDQTYTHTHTPSNTERERSVSVTQLQRQSLICFVVKAVLFLISVVMEMLRCHTALEVSFCTEEEKNLPFCCSGIYQINIATNGI